MTTGRSTIQRFHKRRQVLCPGTPVPPLIIGVTPLTTMDHDQLLLWLSLAAALLTELVKWLTEYFSQDTAALLAASVFS